MKLFEFKKTFIVTKENMVDFINEAFNEANKNHFIAESERRDCLRALSCENLPFSGQLEEMTLMMNVE